MAEDKIDKSCVGWTVDTLYKYFNEKILSLKELSEKALLASDKAVDRAEIISDKKFQSVNEFRESLNDYVHTLMPRKEVELLLKIMASDIEDLKDLNILKKGQHQGLGLGWTIIVGALGLIGTILGMIAVFKEVIR